MIDIYSISCEIACESDKTLLMICQDWFRYWLGAVKLQTTNWPNVDQVLWYHMASLGHNKLSCIFIILCTLQNINVGVIFFQNNIVDLNLEWYPYLRNATLATPLQYRSNFNMISTGKQYLENVEKRGGGGGGGGGGTN